MRQARHGVWTSAEVSRLVTLLSGERDYLECIFNGLQLPIGVISNDLTVDFANAAFWDALGQRPEVALGKPITALTSDRRVILKVIEALESGSTSAVIGHVEFRLTHLPGRDEILMAGIPAARPSTDPLLADEDMPPAPNPTVQFAPAQPLPEAERFTERMDAVSRLAGGLSHELNNILTVITSYCHLALERLGSAGVGTEEIDAILKAATAATHIGASLVSIGRRHAVRDAAADLNSLLRELEPSLRELCGETVQLEMSLDTRIPLLRADPTELRRSVRAIASHAREALGDASGTIAIQTQHDAGGDVTLTIRDNRKWPALAVGPQMFEPYAAFPNTKRTTGLDLSAAYATLRQIRADVTANVTADGLTTISVRFPAEARLHRPGAHTGANIVLVDDNAELRNAIRQTLEHQSYGVLAVGTPHEALQACAEESVDVLVSDINMPEMSGRELAERVRRIRPAIKIVMMSGFADEEIDSYELTGEQVIFLQKPFSPDRLVNAIRTLLPATG